VKQSQLLQNKDVIAESTLMESWQSILTKNKKWISIPPQTIDEESLTPIQHYFVSIV